VRSTIQRLGRTTKRCSSFVGREELGRRLI
jgi:hypothetical protein